MTHYLLLVTFYLVLVPHYLLVLARQPCRERSGCGRSVHFPCQPLVHIRIGVIWPGSHPVSALTEVVVDTSPANCWFTSALVMAMRHHCVPIVCSQDCKHTVGICQRAECTLLLPAIGSHPQHCISSTYPPKPLPSTNQPNHPLVGLPMYVPACSPTNPPTHQPTLFEHLNASAPLVSVGGCLESNKK